MLLAAGALAYCFTLVSGEQLVRVLARADAAAALAAVAAGLLATAAGAWRFKCLYDAVQVLPYVRHLRLYAEAAVFNVLLPSSMGGDVARVWMLGASRPQGTPGALGSAAAPAARHAEALALVAFERVLGVATLLGLSALLWPFAGLPARAGWAVLVLWLALLGSLAIALRWAARRADTGDSSDSSDSVDVGAQATGRRRIGAFVQRMALALALVRQRPGALLVAVFASVLHQALTVAITIFVAKSLGLVLPAALLFALVPLVWLATFVPLTVGGIGVREFAFMQLFGRAGHAGQTAAEDALAMSLGTYGVMLVLGALGGFLLLLRKSPPGDSGRSGGLDQRL